MTSWDCFLSYSGEHRSGAEALAAALREQGVSVWFDKDAIARRGPITRDVEAGLAQSRVLIAYYGEGYAQSAACRRELRAALLARANYQSALERIHVINPESRNDHIHPIELRDARYVRAPDRPDVPAAWTAIVRAVREHADMFADPLGALLARPASQWHGAPVQGTSRFVGRWSDLWKLHGALLAEDYSMIASEFATGGLPCVFVRGLGGQGKTQLVIYYCRQLGGVWPGGVHWISAALSDGTPGERAAALLEQLQFLCTNLEIEIHGKDVAQLRREIGELIDARKQRALWVVDDIPGSASPAEVLAWLAPGKLARTVVTTRSKRFDWENLGYMLDLDTLDPDAAHELLTKHRPIAEAERGIAKELLQELGYHALAVDVTGALLRTESYAEVLRRIHTPDRDALEVAAAIAGELPDQHAASAAATVLASLKRLDEDGRSVMAMAANVARAPVPAELVSWYFAYDEQRASARDEDRRRTTQAVAQAHDQSLAEPEEVSGGSLAYSVHGIVARTIQTSTVARPPEEQRRALVRAATEACAKELEKAQDIQKHRMLAVWMPHARLLARSAADAGGADLLGWVARWDFERGDNRGALSSYRAQLDLREKISGVDDHKTLLSAANVGTLLWALQEFAEARVVFEDVLRRDVKVLGPKHPDTLITMNNLGTILRELGEYEEARRNFEEGLALSREINGPTHEDTLTSLNNLALAYSDLGQPEKALPLHEEDVWLSMQLLGEEHQNTLIGKHNLAETYRELNRLEEARALHTSVLDTRQRVLGREHRETLRSLGNLGRTLYLLGDHKGARTLLDEAVKWRATHDGPHKPLTTQDAWSLYEAQCALEMTSEATDTRRRFLDWLIAADPAHLVPEQRTVRERITKLI
jgi:tetratricopeptide (TPR) repeat protein